MENRKQKEENEMEIDLVSLFFYLIDKWKLLFLGAVVGVVLAGALVFFQTPMYESNSTLYVLSKTTSITTGYRWRDQDIEKRQHQADTERNQKNAHRSKQDRYTNAVHHGDKR